VQRYKSAPVAWTLGFNLNNATLRRNLSQCCLFDWF